MGIPKLFSDLQQYNERVSLGRRSDNGLQRVDRIIIDGPSLVYFVHDRLLTFKSSKTTLMSAAPTYNEIIDATFKLLEDLHSIDVEIQKIYFDGALPILKRDTRLERLEKNRRQLHLLHTAFPKDLDAPHVLLGAFDYESALWVPQASNTKTRALLPPPFMVAAVIEALRLSRFNSAVELVLGEADKYCAAAASLSGCAILTNDSDLSLFDCGLNSCIFWLNSLERSQSSAEPTLRIFTGYCIYPSAVATSLGMSNLIRIGFERSIDSNVSFSVIQRRVRDEKRLQQNSDAFEAFRTQYELPKTADELPTSLRNLDPRILEMAVQLLGIGGLELNDGMPHVYLPQLLEDPTRDAAWSYGASFRMLAYSLLGSIHLSSHKKGPVVECYRKGGRIGRVEFQPCDTKDVIVSATTEIEAHVSSLRKGTTSYVSWLSFALRQVHKQKIKNGKTEVTEQDLWAALGDDQLSKRMTWDILHLHANVQAVFYSLRMLKQAVDVLQEHKNSIQLETQHLSDRLVTLPGISELFLDAHLQSYIIGRWPAGPS